MNNRPVFFEPIRQRASDRWEQLERDPELAGPWHQLFRQVQSPRHVVSELLQNADDAGATEASLRIDDGVFVFTHNGEDFTEEHFASLCRFGYSNKRALHTIGFRGIGFKSTFSLGDTVELRTPTLAVAFDKQRFTQPRWLSDPGERPSQTEVWVAISDAHRQREVEKNLQEWVQSPTSLLFFKHIRRIRVGSQDVHWDSLGPGPVPDTEWMALHSNPDAPFLVVWSELETFPADALAEIRQERAVGDEEDAQFPPCRVESVLGQPGRLYVVLPTGVEPPLPFACNAPFIQDPARLKVKDPETSPTNRWLLGRVGALAASVMLRWLEDLAASPLGRSMAYELLPPRDSDDRSLDGLCATVVAAAFGEAIEGSALLLTDSGGVRSAGESVIIPNELFDVWSGEQAAALFDRAQRPPLCQGVSAKSQEMLVRWGVVESVSKDQVLRVLLAERLPAPTSWRRLLNLWTYIAPDATSYRSYAPQNRKLHIVPVQGKKELYAASEAVRLGERRLLQSDADWDFLAEHLLVLNQNWPRYLAEQRRDAEERADQRLLSDVDTVYSVLRAVGLEDSSEVGAVVQQVAAGVFARESVPLAACVRFAQIAAKLGASAGEAFRFVTRDGHRRRVDETVLYDEHGTLEALFAEAWCAEHLLHLDYSTAFVSCTAEEWRRWVASGRAGLLTFAPLGEHKPVFWRRSDFEDELRTRGFAGPPSYPYRTGNFRIDDWDFDEAHWRHWEGLAHEDPHIWVNVVNRILSQPTAFWSRATNARAMQVSEQGYEKPVTTVPLLPLWALRLRALPCLPDTRGFDHKPSDLLRRTPATESLLDVEPFVHGRLDTEAARPLLTLLDVRDTPTGPGALLDRLRSLAKADTPPLHEVEKWYRRLDQLADTCSTAELSAIRAAFRDERIILVEEGGWATLGGVFLSPGEDVPGAALVRRSVCELALWRKVGIAEQPTADLVVQWLKELPSGKALSQDDARLVRSLLARHAEPIWSEGGHWLNLAGEWASTETLRYALTMQSLVPWSHLYEWVKRHTADLRSLPVHLTEVAPFAALPSLGSQIEDRLVSISNFFRPPERRPWLEQVGLDLSRVVLDDDEEMARIRERAARLAETAWTAAHGIEIVPYIDGTPAGTARRADVVWLETALYVDDLPTARLAKVVPDYLGKEFGRQEITAALNYCYGRSAEDVREYLAENFMLEPYHADAQAPLMHGAAAGVSSLPGGDSGEARSSNCADTDLATGDEWELDAAVIAVGGDEDEDSQFPHIDSDGPDGSSQHARPAPKPVPTNIIERFAVSRGFRILGKDRFVHADGSLLVKALGDRFPWEQRTAMGMTVRRYWPKEHCLEREPLQLAAEIWGLIERSPDTYALVLSDLLGRPVEVTGVSLCDMRACGTLTLYPATYRLVVRGDRDQ